MRGQRAEVDFHASANVPSPPKLKSMEESVKVFSATEKPGEQAYRPKPRVALDPHTPGVCVRPWARSPGSVPAKEQPPRLSGCRMQVMNPQIVLLKLVLLYSYPT